MYDCKYGVEVNDTASCKDKCIKSNGYSSVHAKYESQSALVLDYDSNRYLVAMDGVFETIDNCQITDLTNINCDYLESGFGRQPFRTYLYLNNYFLKIKSSGRGVNILRCGISSY